MSDRTNSGSRLKGPSLVPPPPLPAEWVWCVCIKETLAQMATPNDNNIKDKGREGREGVGEVLFLWRWANRSWSHEKKNRCIDG